MVNGYRAIRYEGHQWYEHRLAWALTFGALPPQLDHINGVRDDNRIANIREATTSQNQANAHKPIGRSGYRNVYIDSRNPCRPYVAKINVRNRQVTLGYFETAEEAGLAAECGHARHHGEHSINSRPSVVAGIFGSGLRFP